MPFFFSSGAAAPRRESRKGRPGRKQKNRIANHKSKIHKPAPQRSSKHWKKPQESTPPNHLDGELRTMNDHRHCCPGADKGREPPDPPSPSSVQANRRPKPQASSRRKKARQRKSHPNANRRETTDLTAQATRRTSPELERRSKNFAAETPPSQRTPTTTKREKFPGGETTMEHINSNPRLETNLDLETIQVPGRFGFPSLSGAGEDAGEEGETANRARNQEIALRLPSLL